MVGVVQGKRNIVKKREVSIFVERGHFFFLSFWQLEECVSCSADCRINQNIV